MNLASLNGADVKLIIGCTVTGGILQILSKQYLKSHPEFLKDAHLNKKKYRALRFLFLKTHFRYEVLIEISRISIKIVAQVTLNFIANKGLLAGLAAVGVVVISKPAVSAYLRDAFPQNLPDLENRSILNFILNFISGRAYFDPNVFYWYTKFQKFVLLHFRR